MVVQAFCSSITTMLATLAILKGVGVGDGSATPLAAALTWMFKGECTALAYLCRPGKANTPRTYHLSNCNDSGLTVMFSVAADGAGMVSRILFTWLQGWVWVCMRACMQYLQQHVSSVPCRVDLDCNAKRWR